jgi:hypothetical protein
MRIRIGISASPSRANVACLNRKRLGRCWYCSIPMTAEALYTMTRLTHTSTRVAVKSSLSDLSFRAIAI